MKHYPHHIGDFDRATRHLTRIERSVYRDLIELYYDTERPLTLDKAELCRKIIARSNEEVTAVEQTLNEFFIETDSGWYHDRCEAEIERYRSFTSQKAMAGKASAAKREEKKQRVLNGCSTGVERESNGTSTNQKPETINHKPETNSIKALATRLPDNWTPSDEDYQFCKTKRPDLEIIEVVEQFKDYWLAIPGAKGRKLNWSATWRNWVRNQRKENRAVRQESEKDRKRRETYEKLTGRKTIHGTAERVEDSGKTV